MANNFAAAGGFEPSDAATLEGVRVPSAATQGPEH